MVRRTRLDRDRETDRQKKQADTDRQTQTDTDRHRQGPHLAMTSLRIKNWSVALAASCNDSCAKQNAAPALRTTHFL